MADTVPQRSMYRNSVGFESVFQHSLAEAMAAGRWHELVAGLGADVTDSVRQTMASLTELVQSQRLGQHEARWLQAPLHRLYQAGLNAQRLSRLAEHASQPAQQNAQEPVELDHLVADAVAHHQNRSRGHRISAELTSLEVMAQPEALASAIDSLLLWGMRLGRSLSLRIVKPHAVPRGELWLKIEHLDGHAHEDRYINSVDWYVLWQLARLKGVKVKRKIEDDRIRVLIQFRRVMKRHSGFAVLEMGLEEDSPGFDPQLTSVWVAIPRQSLCATAVNTLRTQIRNVQPVADLRALIDSKAVPDCVVSTADLIETDAFRKWRRQVQDQRGHNVAVIEITPDFNVFDIGGFGPKAVARVSADSVTTKLLSAVVFELSHLAADF